MLLPETEPWMKGYVDSLDLELGRLFPQHPSTALESAAVDALPPRGNRVRATLALLWCEAFSGDYRPAIPLGVAYELAHASALVQGDIIDRSGTGRGRGSTVAKYGLTTAILASDLLLFNVPKMVAKYNNLNSGRLARILDLVGEACRAATWSEFLDLQIAEARKGTDHTYEEMVRLKVPALLSAPCASGAIVGGASDENVSLASRFGEALGVVYRDQDDMIGARGPLDSASETGIRYARSAKSALDSIPKSKSRTFLLELADYLAAGYRS